MVNVIPQFIKHPELALGLAKRYLAAGKFEYRQGESAHGTGLIPVQSRFRTLYVDHICSKPEIEQLLNTTKFDDDIKRFYQFIQIQYYAPGDFIVPHQDVYHIQELHLITLSGGEHDALVVQDGDQLVRIRDRAGQKIEFDYDAWHWVDPVVDPRFSLVIGV